MNEASAFHSLTTLSIYKMLAQYSSLRQDLNFVNHFINISEILRDAS